MGRHGFSGELRVTSSIVRCLNVQEADASSSMLAAMPTRAKGGSPGFKVAVLGAAGGIGQSLSLLLKMNPLVSVLHLYDVANTPGVTADLSHTSTSAVVSAWPCSFRSNATHSSGART